MKSVMYTSILQTPILLFGSIVVLVLGLKAVGGWDQVLEACRITPVNADGDTMVNLIRSNNDPNFPWLGVLIGSSIIGFWYWCTDQYIVQRVLSGKNETQARRGTIFGAYLKLTPVFLFMIPGMIAFAMMKNGTVVNGEVFSMSSADAAFPTLVATLLPAGLKGLIVCGIMAALLSSLAALFNSSSMLFTIDFYKRFKPDASEKTLLYVGRVATVVVVGLGILWIPIMKNVGSALYNYLQDVQSVLAPGIAAAFLLGILSKRVTPKGGMWGMIAGFVIGIIRLAAKVYYTSEAGAAAADNGFKYLFFDTNWLFFSGGMLVVCMLMIVGISAFTPAASAGKIQGLTFGSVTPEQKAVSRASWNRWDVIHTCIILTITILFYIYFW
jgi:SSS family solute:Na+ symporter